MINNGAISEKIKEYIVNESLEQKDVIQNDTLIFENNLLDSMGFLFLIEFLNTRFHIDIEDSELTEDNFRCVNTISQLVAQKLLLIKEKECI